ncbi:MAG: Clp protease N-terminal domain-containing protein [Gordonia sp. (in: high G+C Gram-positive bacteria)]|uniref:Clp protease N-terminal domain-containing protein n=1 Tax=Gordonia sp. (in: high G+C Gram-positive bacteria) TaxID=84139 RepID=UPI0039E5B331
MPDRFTTDDRITMMFAMQEAHDLGHRSLGNDHLILGMLGNARSPLFALLGAQGLTLDAARETVRRFHEEHAEKSDDAEAASAADRYEEDREALKSIGIDLDKVREAVGGRFDEDLADGWGERPGRGRGRAQGRGRGGDRGERGHRRGHRGHGDHDHGREYGRGDGHAGPGRAGFGPGFGPGFAPGEAGPFGPGPAGFGPGGFRPAGFGPAGFGAGPDPRQAGEGPWEGGRGRRGPRGRRGRARMGSATRTAMRAAVTAARERGDRTLRPEYVLLGILDAGDPASTALIESATTVDALREAVLASLPEVPAAV